jgi:hypothetical protein
MNYRPPLQVKAVKPIVSPIIEEESPQRHFDIVSVYTEMQQTEPPSWILVLEDSSGERFRYNLTFS